MKTNGINSIIIVGGGTAGWMTAARLSKHFHRTSIKITLVESSDIGTVGVGEATIPTLREFYAELGMDDVDVMRATQATCKLGIQFRDWHSPGSAFFHPFGLYGQKANGVGFHHYWLKLRTLGDRSDLADYSLAVKLAEACRFSPPSPSPPSELSVFDWALHFDASLFGQLMRGYAQKHGVQRKDANIERVHLDSTEGHIASLTLDSGETLRGDLYIDCSGFRGLLIEQALRTGFEDWSQWLHCDRAVAVQSERFGEAAPYTVSRAHRGGWQWKIPLQHRQGNGHVYCSQYVSDDEAMGTLTTHIDGPLITEPRSFQFTPGRRKLAWNKNCIAIGLASGFIEPLESTSIALVETAIHKICRAFPGPFYTQKAVDEFNNVTAQEYERVRDFIILHYKANGRTDSPFWQQCRDMPIPETLERKIQAYRTNGDLIRYPVEIFGEPSWLAIYSGLGIYPEHYHPNVDRLDPAYLQESLTAMRQSVAQAVGSAPRHDDYIKKYCAAAAPA